jgi:hypothetical protein
MAGLPGREQFGVVTPIAITSADDSDRDGAQYQSASIRIHIQELSREIRVSCVAGGKKVDEDLAAIARSDLKQASCRVRLVEVGESAGPTILLAAAVLRSSRLEILGAGSGSAAATPEIWIEAIRHLMSNIGCGTLRIDTERVPLCEMENAWHQEQHGRRAVIIP